MASNVDIINRALSLIGQECIISFDDRVPVAAKVRKIWGEVRDSVLRAYNWKCCAKRQALARIAADSVFGYAYQFQLPLDFIRLIETEPKNLRYQIEARRLLANKDNVKILYVSKEEDANNYDPQLREALAFKLASELAYADTASLTLAKNLEILFQERLKNASSSDSCEGDMPDISTYSSWASAKRG